jgi:hypothetical protein
MSGLPIPGTGSLTAVALCFARYTAGIALRPLVFFLEYATLAIAGD